MKIIYPKHFRLNLVKGNISMLTTSMLILLLTVLLSNVSHAQTFRIGTADGQNTSSTYPSPLQDYYEGARQQYLYTAADLLAAGLSANDTIKGLSWNVLALNGAGIIEDFSIRMSATTTSSLGSTSWEPAGTLVYGSVNYQPVLGHNIFVFTTHFIWDGISNILIGVCNGDPLNTSTITYTNNPSIAYDIVSYNSTRVYRTDNQGNLCNYNSTGIDGQSGVQDFRPVVTLHKNNFCTSFPSNLAAQTTSVSTADITWTAGTGSQWEIRYGLSGFQLGSGTIITSTSSPATLSGLNANTSYDVYIRTICGPGDSTLWIGPVSFTTLCITPLSGTYTINQSQPVTATNYHSIAAIASDLTNCGVSGAVTINVLPGTYTQQVVLGQIAGASSTNTITINGNGHTLQFTGTTSNRAAITLNGADWVTIDSLNIIAMDPTFGWGIHLMNQANNNTIINNTINLMTVTSTALANSTGIAVSASNSSTASTGNNASNLLIEGNEIIGGYHSISLNGASATLSSGNIIRDNILRDFHVYGIYLSFTDVSLIEENDISRANRISVGSFYGIYVTSLNSNLNINSNRIHDTHNSATTQSGLAYGISFVSTDAPVGSENIVYNNAIYNFNSTTGTIYGLYNSGSDGTWFYHNTVVLDNNNATSGTTRGFFQTTLATNVRFRNNIVTVTRAGTGEKYALYFGTTTSAITSNNNVLFVNAPAGTSGIGYYTSARTTIAAWRTASGQDINSTDANPVLSNPLGGNLKPLSAAVDNLGAPLGILTDIVNVTRSATTPDAGAWEFTGIAADISLVSARLQNGTCLSSNDSIYFTIRNVIGSAIDFSVNPLTAVWTITGPVNSTGSITINSGTLAANTSMQIGRAGMDLSLPGNYTLNMHILSNAVNLSPLNDTLINPATLNVIAPLSIYPASDTITSTTQTVTLTALSPFLPTGVFIITEVTQFKTATGAPTAGWPSYLLADDYIEITGAPGSDLGGITLEQWDGTSMLSTHTFPVGTLLSPNGTAIIAVGEMGSSVSSPANYYYHGNGTYTGTFSSGGNNGRVLKSSTGAIIDAVGYGTIYTFPAASGVTSNHWSGNTASASSTSGIRLIGPDMNNASSWVVSSTTNPQNPNIVNMGIAASVPVEWIHQGNQISVSPQITVGPFASAAASGTYQYIARYNSITCGLVIDTAIIVVNIPAIDDIALASILQPVNGCGDSNSAVVVRIANPGTTIQSNILVTVQYTGAASGILTNTFTGTLMPGQTADINMGMINTYAGGTFNFTAYSQVTGDQNLLNDTMRSTVIIDAIPVPASQFGNQCIASGASVNIIANNLSYNYTWFDGAGNPIGTGDTLMITATMDMDIFAEAINPTVNMCAGPRRYMGTIRIAPGTVVIPQVQARCFAEPSFQIPVNISGGLWSGTGITNTTNGTFDPATAGVGNHQVIYTLTGANGCISADTTTITVITSPNATISGPTSVCAAGANVTFTAPSMGGVWSGPGILNASAGTFNPAAAGVGSHIITYEINLVGCFGIDTHMIHVRPTPVATFGPTGPYCSNNPPVMLTPVQAGGAFSGTGVVGNMFNPSVAGAGFHQITYNITNSFGCSNASTVTIEVRLQPDATITGPAALCFNSAPVQYIVPTTGGIWNGNGLNSTGMFNPAVAGLGVHRLTYTFFNNGCNDTDTFFVTVNNIPSVSITAINPLCANAAPVQLVTNISGGTWSGTGVNASGMFNPAVAGIGSHTVSYTFTNQNGCTSIGTRNIQVVGAPVVTIAAVGPYCSNNVAVALSGSPSGGVWSGAGVVNPFTGVFNPANAGMGTHTISYTVSNGNGCTSTATTNITVNAGPNATIAATGSICGSGTAVQLSAATAGGTWSGTGVSASGMFNPAVAGPGAHLITYSVTAGGCTSTSTRIINVSTPVVLTANIKNGTCAGNSDAVVDLNVLGGNAPYTYAWSNGSTSQDLYNIGAGSYTVTVTDINNCATTGSFTVTASSAITAVTDSIVPNSTPSHSHGAVYITVSGGMAPYEYVWSNGANTQDLMNVRSDSYTLTIYDVMGCSVTYTYTVPSLFGVGIDQNKNIGKVVLYPNPTSGRLVLDVELTKMNDVSYEVLDVIGRVITSRSLGSTERFAEQLDLTGHAAGQYLIRLKVGDEVLNRKFIITK